MFYSQAHFSTHSMDIKIKYTVSVSFNTEALKKNKVRPQNIQFHSLDSIKE